MLISRNFFFLENSTLRIRKNATKVWCRLFSVFAFVFSKMRAKFVSASSVKQCELEIFRPSVHSFFVTKYRDILTRKLKIFRPSVHSFFVTNYGDILPQTSVTFCHRLWRFFAQVLTTFSSLTTETFCPSVCSFFVTNFEDILAHLWWLEFAQVSTCV